MLHPDTSRTIPLLEAALYRADVGEDLGAAPDLDRGGHLGELGDEDLSLVEAFGVVGAGVGASGQAHDDDAVLEGLDHDVAGAPGGGRAGSPVSRSRWFRFGSHCLSRCRLWRGPWGAPSPGATPLVRSVSRGRP